MPDTVSVALSELAGELREGLLAPAVGTGLQVLAAMMEQDVTAACGPKGRHDRARTATRHGHSAGSVTWAELVQVVHGLDRDDRGVATRVVELTVAVGESHAEVTFVVNVDDLIHLIS